MRVLGIDPGIATTGYGIVEKVCSNLVNPGIAQTGRGIIEKELLKNDLVLIKTGIIKTEKGIPQEERLLLIYKHLLSIIDEFKPASCVIEDIFFFKNAKTAMKISEVKGVCLLASSYSGISAYTYTPLQIKQALTGFGRGTKHQVQEMVKRMLGLEDIFKPDDASDALACAICHIQSLWSKGI